MDASLILEWCTNHVVQFLEEMVNEDTPYTLIFMDDEGFQHTVYGEGFESCCVSAMKILELDPELV